MQLLDKLSRIFEEPVAPPPPHLLEARRSPRIDTIIRASFDGGSFMQEREGNVSLDGFCFDCRKGLPTGSRVKLLVRLTGTKDWVRATGEVLGTIRSHGRTRVRGRFTRIHIEEERMLRRWMDDQAQAGLAA